MIRWLLWTAIVVLLALLIFDKANSASPQHLERVVYPAPNPGLIDWLAEADYQLGKR